MGLGGTKRWGDVGETSFYWKIVSPRHYEGDFHYVANNDILKPYCKL